MIETLLRILVFSACLVIGNIILFTRLGESRAFLNFSAGFVLVLTIASVISIVQDLKVFNLTDAVVFILAGLFFFAKATWYTKPK